MNKNLLISVISPVFNEESGLKIFYDRLERSINNLEYDFEIIFVNDGSTDNSLDVLASLHEKDRRIKIIDLSRNFGHQNALTAGIDCAKGNAIILIDVDLEDNPAYIASFIDYWQKGYSVIYAKRNKRNTSWFRGVCFAIFHKMNRMMSRVNVDAAGTFCLMERKVVDHLRKLSEKDRYIPGLRAWLGFRQIGIEVARDARYDKSPRVRFISLFKLALDSFTAFSTAPLKLSMFLGVIFSILSFISIIVIVILKLFLKMAILGWASTISVILLLGGVQLICIWLQGEYLARVFNEVKNRPNYIVKDKIGFDE